jgi:sugar porter (SP) family MFS transporter
LGSAIAPEVFSFMAFRFIGGIGVGASSVVAPMYISEISPAKNRGQLVALFQFNLVFGILIAYLSNYLIDLNIEENSWRWMLGMEAIPALIYTLLVFRVPQSPRWLIAKKDDFENAEKILKQTDPEGVEEAIRLALEEKKLNKIQVGFMALFHKKYIKITFLAILIALFNQLSGINAIIYFAPRIFDMAGISAESALLSTVGIGIVNMIATMLGLFLIDRIGRKKLMYIGSAGYIVSLLLIAYSFSGAQISSTLLPVFMFMFIASHAVGQGAVIWVFISEIFPNELRAHGQSIGCFTHWILAALVANIFPLMANQFGPVIIFSFFAVMMVLQLIWVYTKMPETKGRSLEEIQKDFIKENG